MLDFLRKLLKSQRSGRGIKKTFACLCCCGLNSVQNQFGNIVTVVVTVAAYIVVVDPRNLPLKLGQIGK